MPIGDIKKAKEAGYHTIMSLLLHPKKVGHQQGGSLAQGCAEA
jgi:hypothetical protein